MLPLPRFLQLDFVSAAELGGAAPAVSLAAEVANFSMTCQEEMQWCWAAVTQSVENWRGSDVSQSEIASSHVSPDAPNPVCVHPLDSSSDGSFCNTCHRGCGGPHSLGSVLNQRGRLSSGGAVQGIPKFEDITAAIDDQRPIPIRIDWGNDSGHFICLFGYFTDDSGVRRVRIYDPLLPSLGGGDAEEQTLEYNMFATAYPANDGSTGTPNYHYKVQ
jgi:hypothetical protein